MCVRGIDDATTHHLPILSLIISTISGHRPACLPLDVVRVGSVRSTSSSVVGGGGGGGTAAKYSFELKETRVFLYQVNRHSSCVYAACRRLL